eukprot:3377833-Rhodomonas_salina.2
MAAPASIVALKAVPNVAATTVLTGTAVTTCAGSITDLTGQSRCKSCPSVLPRPPSPSFLAQISPGSSVLTQI